MTLQTYSLFGMSGIYNEVMIYIVYTLGEEEALSCSRGKALAPRTCEKYPSQRPGTGELNERQDDESGGGKERKRFGATRYTIGAGVHRRERALAISTCTLTRDESGDMR